MSFLFKEEKWYLVRSENVTSLSTTMPRFQLAYALPGPTIIKDKEVWEVGKILFFNYIFILSNHNTP